MVTKNRNVARLESGLTNIMKKEKAIRMIIDCVMTVLFFVMMAHQLTGDLIHEIIGIVELVLFFVHNILNIKWYKSLFKGKYTVFRIVWTVINILLVITVLGTGISAMSISRSIFPSSHLINIPNGREIHLVCAYWTFVLIGVHIGLHWTMIVRKNDKNEKTFLRNCLLNVAMLIIVIYGCYAFVKRDIGSYLALYNSYSFWDYSEWPGWFFIDLAAIMGTCICVTNYILKLVKRCKARGEK